MRAETSRCAFHHHYAASAGATQEANGHDGSRAGRRRSVGTLRVSGIGLEPHWYIAGYNNVLQQAATIMGRQARFSGARSARMIAAVTKAAMLDMDIAVSVYGETLIQQITDREERVHAAIGEFDASIGCMLGKFATMTADLGTSSGELEAQTSSVTARCNRIRGSQQTVALGMLRETGNAD